MCADNSFDSTSIFLAPVEALPMALAASHAMAQAPCRVLSLRAIVVDELGDVLGQRATGISQRGAPPAPTAYWRAAPRQTSNRAVWGRVGQVASPIYETQPAVRRCSCTRRRCCLGAQTRQFITTYDAVASAPGGRCAGPGRDIDENAVGPQIVDA